MGKIIHTCIYNVYCIKAIAPPLAKVTPAPPPPTLAAPLLLHHANYMIYTYMPYVYYTYVHMRLKLLCM